MSIAVLTISRYPAKHIVTAFHSMALFRPSLALNKAMAFYKLMGSGKNGTFDKNPDWQKYAIFSVSDKMPDIDPKDHRAWRKAYYGSFIDSYWNWAGAETETLILEPLMCHGKWDGKEVFKDIHSGKDQDGPIAVLTRATIRLSRAREFWANVPPVQQQMQHAKGLLYSIGIGEMPYLRQATFSIWENAEALKNFAYKLQEHREVINLTRTRQWYSEEMFTRFRIISCEGSIKARLTK